MSIYTGRPSRMSMRRSRTTRRKAKTRFFFFQAEDGIRDLIVTGVQTCALPIYRMSSQAPDDQLRSELNSAVGRPATSHPANLVPGEDQAQRHAEQYVTPTAAITFNPAVPPAAAQADTRTTDHASHSNPKPRSGQKGARPAEPINKNTSHNDDSLLPPAASQPPTTAEPPKPGEAPGMQSIQLATNQDSPSEAQQPSVAATSNNTAPPGTAQSPFNDTSANPDKSKGRQADPSLAHRS